MGNYYIIRCNRCGARIEYRMRDNYGMLPQYVGCGATFVETQIPMRCPECFARLNASREEFNSQIEVATAREWTEIEKTTRKISRTAIF